MPKTTFIKLTKVGSRTGPKFDIYDDLGNILAKDVTKSTLKTGISLQVDNAVKVILIKSLDGCNGTCTNTINVPITTGFFSQLPNIQAVSKNTASLWRHLTSPIMYNHFYGNIEPYIIEYPFAYKFNDEILQNVKDYTKVYRYFQDEGGVWNDNNRIEIDDAWFNKAVLYNNQQSTGILELVPKPKNNLSEYGKYPTYNAESKTIVFTKSDNFYLYNTFWSLVKNKQIPLFVTDCCSTLSIDKLVNQANMDYGKRSFKKEPLRAKDLKVRHILDNRSDVHLTSQFIVTPAQISYK